MMESSEPSEVQESQWERWVEVLVSAMDCSDDFGKCKNGNSERLVSISSPPQSLELEKVDNEQQKVEPPLCAKLNGIASYDEENNSDCLIWRAESGSSAMFGSNAHSKTKALVPHAAKTSAPKQVTPPRRFASEND